MGGLAPGYHQWSPEEGFRLGNQVSLIQQTCICKLRRFSPYFYGNQSYWLPYIFMLHTRLTNILTFFIFEIAFLLGCVQIDPNQRLSCLRQEISPEIDFALSFLKLCIIFALSLHKLCIIFALSFHQPLNLDHHYFSLWASWLESPYQDADDIHDDRHQHFRLRKIW